MTGIVDSHTFSYSNVGGTAHIDTLRINGSGIDSAVPIKFLNNIGKKLILFENQVNAYNAYMINIEAGCMRFNVNESTSYFKWGSANANINATGFTDMLTLSGASLISQVPIISTKDISLQQLTSTSLKTYDDIVTSYVTTYNNGTLAATITVGPHYGKEITVSTPISMKASGGVTPPQTASFSRSITSATCSVLKGGVAFSTPIVSSNNGYGIVKTYVGSNNPYSVEQYFTNLIVTFRPAIQSTTATYTINITTAGTSTFYLNTTISNYVSSYVGVNSASGVNYSAANYSENMYNINDRTGHVEVKDLTVSNNLLIGSTITSNSLISNSIVSNSSTILNGTTTINSREVA